MGIGNGQKAAWFILHRLRAVFELSLNEPFAGPVEVDETYIGGKRRNMSNSRREEFDMPGVDIETIRKAVFQPIDLPKARKDSKK
ncbi:MAG: hypothetical protein OXF06_04810 [Bacteroidetes bacterium]|nr:hypothetical protein [Bacteroidota bacterium]